MLKTTLFPLSMALAVGLAPALSHGQQPGRRPQAQPGQAQQPQQGQRAQQPQQGQRAQQPQQGGQTAEAQWFDALPGDLPIVLRVGGLERATDNFVTMLRAMSPEAAQQVGSQIQATVSEFTRSLGAGQGQAPAMILIDVVPPGQLGDQIAIQGGKIQFKPRAIAVFATNDYNQALSAIAGQEVQPQRREGGVDAITAANGEQVFAVNKQGFAAISQHEDLVRRVAGEQQQGQTLAQTLSEDLRSQFLEGDLGLYVDLAQIAETYGDQMEQAQAFIRQQAERAGGEGGNFAQQTELASRELIEAARNARAVAAHADFAEQGLTISGKLAMNEDYEPIRRMAEAGDNPAEELGTLPRGNAYYSFDMFDPEAMNWEMIPGADQIRQYLPEIAAVIESPEFERAKQQFRAAGKSTYIATVGLGETRTGLSVLKAENPGSVVEAVRSAVAAVKDKDFALIKELAIEQGAQEHQGYSFDKITASYDFEAFANEVEEQAKKVAPEGAQDRVENPPVDRQQAIDLIRRVVGESTTVWVGSNGEQVVNLLAANWEDAQKQLDAYLANDQGIGQTESFRKVRAQLPERVRSLYMVDVQTGTRQVLAEARQATENQDLRAGQQMPEQPAMVGLALVAEQDGLRFQGFVPSEVGPVVEKGIVPLIEQQLNQQGQGQQRQGQGQQRQGQGQQGQGRQQPRPGQQPGQQRNPAGTP